MDFSAAGQPPDRRIDNPAGWTAPTFAHDSVAAAGALVIVSSKYWPSF